MPGRGLVPLLYVRFAGPPGMRAAFYQGQARERAFDAPVQVGMRPGYLYRVRLSNLPGLPDVSLYPTLEVFGSLPALPGVNPGAYAAPVVLTPDDVERALAGVLVTKVVYLEHPDRAPPAGTLPGEVPEAPVPPGRDIMAEAWDLGRPVLVLRLGGRVPPPEELVRQPVYGTILFPGEKVLAQPRLPPCLPCGDRPFCDPVIGCRPPEECVHDGGDRGVRAGIDAEGNLLGLDPEDTVAAYTDGHGRRRLTCSNRVCLCVPHFAVLRAELPLAAAGTVIGPGDTTAVRAQEQARLNVPSLEVERSKQLQALAGRLRPSVNRNSVGVGRVLQVQVLNGRELVVGPIELLGTRRVQQLTEVERVRLLRQVELALQLSLVEGLKATRQVYGTAVVGRVEGGPQVVVGTLEARDLTVCCFEAPCPPDRPLVLVKCADRHSAQPGDVVTFTLRYSNLGGRPITDVAVSDSLSGRLEYVPGSAQSDRDAVLTLQENEAGSVILHWEVGGRLLPGDSGTLRFQVRVR
jgi:uncharacterized repeat protein (TIGR01451 family)